MKNVAKSMMLIGIGVGATMAYQKYSKPVMKEMEKFANKTMKKMNAFERLKRLRDDKFSLRVRMTCMVSAEILVCIILSYFISSFFNNRFHIKVPIIL